MLELHSNKKPLFISFEGGEGCGKTTQLKLIESILAKQNIDTIFTREPGGTEDSEKIRSMLLTGDADRWSTTEELLMFSAARSQHIRKVIKPALNNGKWVISDRFADSTTVYQGIAKKYNLDTVNMLHNLAIDNCWPDLTIILDIPVSKGLARKQEQAEGGLDEMRMESLGSSFHELIRAGFLKIAKQNPKRIKVIDASGTIEEVQQQIIDAINIKLLEK